MAILFDWLNESGRDQKVLLKRVLSYVLWAVLCHVDKNVHYKDAQSHRLLVLIVRIWHITPHAGATTLSYKVVPSPKVMLMHTVDMCNSDR